MQSKGLHLRLWQKLAALGALTAILVAVPFGLYLGEYRVKLDRVQEEIKGLQQAQLFLGLMQRMQAGHPRPRAC